MSQEHSQQQLAIVQQLAQQQRFKEAFELAQEITNENPQFGAAWYMTAFMAFHCQNHETAIKAMKTARVLEPNNQNYAFQEILLYETLNRPDLMLPLAQELIEQPVSVQMHEKVADILVLNEDFDGAYQVYQKLIQQQPNNIQWLLKQAMVLQSLGKIDAASLLCERALELEPKNVDVQLFQSHLKKYTKQHNHIDRLTANSNNQFLARPDRAKLYFALAKELEDCQQYDQSFAARKTGADLYRSCFQYDLQSDLDFMRQVQIEYNTEFVQQKATENTSNQPIFIVGLPRSGTTLLDRIITSHSEVKAAGELRQLNKAVLLEIQNLKLSAHLSRTDMVTASKSIDFEQLGQNYLLTTSARSTGKARFTDKFPQNSYYVGMVLKALPKAKVIIMQRHPVSVCYAVYKQLFSDGSYPFSYNLEEMAHYYNQHNQLLNHWQTVGGDAVKTVFYEDLVNDLETQAKDIVRFLDLPWQPQCLDFHKNKQPTATASASQVREKLYTSSVDLWRNYEQQLQPLISLIDKAP